MIRREWVKVFTKKSGTAEFLRLFWTQVLRSKGAFFVRAARVLCFALRAKGTASRLMTQASLAFMGPLRDFVAVERCSTPRQVSATCTAPGTEFLDLQQAQNCVLLLWGQRFALSGEGNRYAVGTQAIACF